MQLRDYQEKAVQWLCENPCGIVVAPAGSGKTWVAAAALRRTLESDPAVTSRVTTPAIGWIANTKEQVEQAEAALRTFGVHDFAPVVVRCAAAGNSWSTFDGLIVDECHHSMAPEWRKQIESCAGVRWGFSATPWGRDKERNADLLTMFGGAVHVIEREEVGAQLAPARVVWLDAADEGLRERIDAETEKVLAQRMRFRRYQCMPPAQARGEVAWGVCSDLGIHRNSARNIAAWGFVAEHQEPTIVLCGLVEHAKEMAGIIGGTAVWSGMPVKARRAAIADFRAGKVQRLVATSLLDEGADLPCASVLVLLSGGRNEARTIQRTGRVLRPFPGKETAVIYDFKDTFHPMMARHAEKRSRVYQNLGYAGAEIEP